MKHIKKGNILVLGLGNPILTDDGIGHVLIDELQKYFSNSDIKFEKINFIGMHNFEFLFNYETVFIIDAILQDKDIGTLTTYSIDDFQQTIHTSSHDLGFREVLDYGKRWFGSDIASNIVVFGINVKDVTSFNESLSHPLIKKIPDLIETIKSKIEIVTEVI